MRWILLALAVAVAPAAARTSLGTFDHWGAFRDERPLRCFAIAEPSRNSGGSWRAFAAVSSWPQAGVRGQVHIRLSRAVMASAPVTLAVGERRFAMVAGGADVWAPDARADAAIVANLRSASGFAVSARATTGGTFSESYALKGAATAIDAASLGCARR